MSARAVVLAAALSAAGCIVTPTVPHTPYDTQHRGEIVREDFLAFEPGTTTRADVLLLLGEPDLHFDDDRVFAYVWDEAWLFFAAGGYGGGAAGEATRHLALMFAFDDAGRLVRKDYLAQPQLGSDKEWYARLRLWR